MTTSPLSPDQLPPIHTQADLEQVWRLLMGELGFSRTSLWVMPLTADGRVTPMLIPIDDIPSRPTDSMEGLTEVCRTIVPPGGSVAFLLTRPGGGTTITPSERAWTRALGIVARSVGGTSWPVHRANDEVLAVCSPDDLAA